MGGLTPEDRSKIKLAIVVVIALAGILGLMQVFGGWPYLYAVTNIGTPVGIFANRNHMALLLAIAFPLIAAWVSESRSGGRSRGRFRINPRVAIGLLGCVAVLPLLLINGSRGGLLAAGIGVIGAAAMVLRDRTNRRDRRVTLVVTAGAAVVALVVIGIFVTSSRDVAFTRLAASEDIAERRLVALPTVLDLARDNWVFGAGAGTFDPVFRMREPDSMVGPTYFNHAHNDFLEMVIELGVLGMALLASFAAWSSAKAFQAWRSPSGGSEARLGSILLVQIAAMSAVDYPLRTPFIASLACYATVLLAGARLASAAKCSSDEAKFGSGSIKP